MPAGFTSPAAFAIHPPPQADLDAEEDEVLPALAAAGADTLPGEPVEAPAAAASAEQPGSSGSSAAAAAVAVAAAAGGRLSRKRIAAAVGSTGEEGRAVAQRLLDIFLAVPAGGISPELPPGSGGSGGVALKKNLSILWHSRLTMHAIVI